MSHISPTICWFWLLKLGNARWSNMQKRFSNIEERNGIVKIPHAPNELCLWLLCDESEFGLTINCTSRLFLLTFLVLFWSKVFLIPHKNESFVTYANDVEQVLQQRNFHIHVFSFHCSWKALKSECQFTMAKMWKCHQSGCVCAVVTPTNFADGCCYMNRKDKLFKYKMIIS